MGPPSAQAWHAEMYRSPIAFNEPSSLNTCKLYVPPAMSWLNQVKLAIARLPSEVLARLTLLSNSSTKVAKPSGRVGVDGQAWFG